MNIANNLLKHALQNVYFLVGTACGGKTTMAQELSRRYGLACFIDNWTEPPHALWQSLINPKYQPNATARREIDWEAYFSRSVAEFLADKNDNHGAVEYLEFAILELVRLSAGQKVVADVWFDARDLGFLLDISDPGRIACLLAPGELIIRDYYTRADHANFTNCIRGLKNPEQKFETQNELFRLGASDFADAAKAHGLFTLTRSETSTVDEYARLLSAHFKF